MKYLKTIFIASVLLNVYSLRTEEPVLYPFNTDDTQNFPMSDFLMPVETSDLFKPIFAITAEPANDPTKSEIKPTPFTAAAYSVLV